jgi:hypothetical protein
VGGGKERERGERKKRQSTSYAWWYVPVIPATQKAEIGKLPAQAKVPRPFLKKKKDYNGWA